VPVVLVGVLGRRFGEDESDHGDGGAGDHEGGHGDGGVFAAEAGDGGRSRRPRRSRSAPGQAGHRWLGRRSRRDR
jgi:hypothetical protein